MNRILAAVALCLLGAACGADADDTTGDAPSDAAEDVADVQTDVSSDTNGQSDVGADAQPEGKPCGSDSGEECPEGYQCVFPRSGAAGCEGMFVGACEAIPTECPEPEPEDFVCRDAIACIGVGGYESECIARSRGYALALADWPCLGVECQVAEDQTWCPPDVDCISSESECHDGETTSGTCQFAPTSCDPATPDDARCACNGTRYDSECHARLEGYFGTLTVCDGSGT